MAIYSIAPGSDEPEEDICISNNTRELSKLIATALDIATSGHCQVSEVAIELMRRREAGEVISKNERHRLIIENALKRT